MEQAELAEIDATMETTPPPATAEALLGLARSLIEDNLLTEAQLSVLQSSPFDYLRELVTGRVDVIDSEHPAFAMASEVCNGIVRGYFQSLLAKASEGEKFDEVRLKKALLKAQVAAVEALEGALSGATPDMVVAIAGALQN